MKLNLRKVSILLLLASLVYITYGNTLKMYYWVDDWGLVFKMIFPALSPMPSNYGAGIYGEGAYRYGSTIFTWLYDLFKLNATAYFMVGLMQYFLLVIVVYLFVKDLSEDEEIGLLAGIIFSAGYFGSYAMYRLSNSYQVVETALMVVISCYSLIRYFKTNKKYFYWFSLLVYIATLEFMFLRAHGFLFTIVAIFLIVGVFLEKRSLLKSFFEIFPFVPIFIFFYFVDYRGGIESSGTTATQYLLRFVEQLKNNSLNSLKSFLETFSNLIIPDQILKLLQIEKYLWLIGLIDLTTITIFVLLNWQKKRKLVALISLGSVWIVANFLIYFFYNPLSSLTTNSRYLMPSSVGTAIILAVVIHLIEKKYLRYIVVALVVFILIYLNKVEQARIIKYVSIPDKQGYELLLDKVGSIDQGTLFLFDSIDDPNYKNSIFGGVPQMGIPPLYGKSWVAQVAESNSDFFERLVEGGSSVDNFESFFHTKNGHVYTTDNLRQLLKFGETPEKIYGRQIEGKEDTYEFVTSYPSLVPISVKVVDSIDSQNLEVYWKTDRLDSYSKNYMLTTDSDYFIIPPGGTVLEGIQIHYLNGQSGGEDKKIVVKSLSLSELRSMNLYK